MTTPPPLPSATVTAPKFQDIQSVYAQLLKTTGIREGAAQPQTLLSTSTPGTAAAFSDQLTPLPITPRDLAVSLDLRAYNRLSALFTTHSALSGSLAFIHNAAENRNITLLNREDMLPAVHAYLGLMQFAQGTQAIFDAKQVLLTGAIEAVMNPDSQNPTEARLKDYISKERWPNAYKSDPDIADIIIGELLDICTRDNLRFQENGDLDIRAIDALRDEVFPRLANTVPDLLAAISQEEDSYPARCVAVALKGNPPPPLPREGLVAIPKAQALEALATIAAHPRALDLAKQEGIEEGKNTGREAAKRELHAHVTSMRKTADLAKRNSERTEALVAAPQVLIESGFGTAKPLLEKRMAYLISVYFREVFGDNTDEQAVAITSELARGPLVSFHLRKAWGVLGDSGISLTHEALENAERQVLLAEFKKAITQKQSDIVARLSSTVLAEISSAEENSEFVKLLEIGFARLEGIVSCTEIVADMKDGDRKDQNRNQEPQPRNPLDLLRDFAKHFDGSPKAQAAILKQLHSPKLCGAAAQAMIEEALRNPHCAALLASDQYVVDANRIAWGQPYSHKHITDRQIVSLAQTGNQSAIAILKTSLTSGYHHTLRNSSEPFSPLHPKLMSAVFVLAAVTGDITDDINISIPTLDQWGGKHNYYECVYSALQISSLHQKMSRDSNTRLRRAILEFREISESITAQDLRDLNGDNQFDAINKIMVGILFGHLRKNRLSTQSTADNPTQTDDSAMTVATEMATAYMDDEATYYIDASESATRATIDTTQASGASAPQKKTG